MASKGCLALLSGYLLAGCRPGGSGSGAVFETVPAARHDIRQAVTASGTLSAVTSVDVGSQISGQIETLCVDYNSLVKKNQLVAQIEPSIYRAAVNQAEAELANSQASRDLAQITARRAKDLARMHAGPISDADKADAELRQAEATVLMKKAALDKAAADLDHCRILSPIDGVVIARKVDPGQTVAAAMTTPILFTIAEDVTKMQIVANVAEADIGQVKVGQTVHFTVDAYADEVFEGKVSQVRRSATTTDNVVTYGTVVDVANPEEKLFPGMTAEVSIMVAERQGAVTIPNTALRFAPPDGVKLISGDDPLANAAGQRLVYQDASHGALRPLLVKIGITDGTNSEILGGLREGDRVVVDATVPHSQSGGGPPPPGGGPVP